jgi:hypothetical protein
MNVQKTASLHEKAVQKVARGEHKVPRARRTSSKARSSRVTQAHMLDGLESSVQEEVKRMLGREVEAGGPGDLRRVQVVSSTEAIIWNHSAPWPVGSQSELSAS